MASKFNLFTREAANPILTAEDWPYPVNAVMNPAAARLKDGTTLLLCRVEDREGKSHLTIARSQNGVDNWKVEEEPFLSAEVDSYPEELWGVEDPRITYVAELDEYVIVYVAYSHSGPGVSLARTKDFVTVERCGMILPPLDKDAALFPRKISGHWVIMHRPMRGERNDMWMSQSPDLIHWGRQRIVLEARVGSWWDATRIGLAGPPIETEEGWLVLYHGVKRMVSGANYRLGVALFDIDDPSVCVLRGGPWIMSSEEVYERVGDADNVVFPCGQTVDGDDINLYYGAADTCICLARGRISEILDWLHENGSPPPSEPSRY